MSLLILFFSQFAAAGSLHCAEIDSIIPEAIAYHLTGAPTSALPNNCAKKMKWKYFNPNIETRPQGDVPNAKLDYLYFDPKRDKYTIDKIRKEDTKYFIDVDFKIAGKPYRITYTYEPNAALEKYHSVCGTIDHKEKPWIFRSDCRK